MELEGPQDSATGPYRKPDKSQSTSSHPISPGPILNIKSYHLCLGLTSGLFPPDFPTTIFYTFLFSLMRATCPRP